MSANGYPFQSRKRILERINAEPFFAAECIAILQERHERRVADGTESMGWMASHAAKATKLAARLASGEATEKERVEATQLAQSYAKQLARVFRDRDLAARPDLAAQAAVFGVGATNNASAGASQAAKPSDASDAEEAPAEPEPAPRKRGRPKGSKNKPRTNQPARRPRSRA